MPVGPVCFDGGLVTADAPGAFVVVVCTEEGSGAVRWQATFEPVRSPYSYPNVHGLTVTGNLLFVVTIAADDRGGTPSSTNVHCIAASGRVAWGVMVDAAGGDATISSTVGGVSISVGGRTTTWDVETGTPTESPPARTMSEARAAELLRALSQNAQALDDYTGEASTAGFYDAAEALRVELRALGSSAVPSLLAGLASEDSVVKREALDALFRAAPMRAIELAAAYTKDADGGVRYTLAARLRDSDDPRALDLLARDMLEDTGPLVRKIAYAALAARDAARAELVLRRLLGSDDPATRADVLDALIEMKSDAARVYLEARAAGESGRSLQSTLYRLRAVSDRRSLETLTRGLRDPLAAGNAAAALLRLVEHFGTTQTNALLDAGMNSDLYSKVDVVETLRALFRRWAAVGCDVLSDRERARKVVENGLAGRPCLPPGASGSEEATHQLALVAWIGAACDLGDPRLFDALIAMVRLPVLESPAFLALASALRPFGARATDALRELSTDPACAKAAQDLLRYFDKAFGRPS